MKVELALLVGVTGLRLDHELYNLHIAQKFCVDMDIEVHENFGTGRFIVPQKSNEIFSYEYDICM